MKENLKLARVILWEQVSSLFFVLLVVSAGVSFFLGEKVDGIIIAVIIFINTFLGFIQEYKASKASEQLLHLIETKVYVLRAGNLVMVKTSDLVLGDVVHLVPGSIVPVDIEIIEADNAFIDDSVRTGESLPKEVFMGERLFSGAVVTTGKIIGQVIQIGDESSLSKYRAKLESVKKWSSFNVFTEKVIKYIFIISLVTLIISMFFLVVYMSKYSLLHFFVFAIAMLVGVVPEVLPLIVTIILTRESISLSENKVIVKRLSSLESLGAISFLLTDKTGTITENKLRVAAVTDIHNFWENSNYISEGQYERTGLDAVYDEALNQSIGKIKTNSRTIKYFDPFDRLLGYEVFVIEGGVKIARGIASKIFSLCKRTPEKILKSALEYEKKGMRVIALAEGQAGEWTFSGFVAFVDPIKDTSAASLKLAADRGIQVKILTGDSKEVGLNVANELHLIKDNKSVISFDDVRVADLSDKDLIHATLFARCTPENKLELIDRYLKIGPVAFLGDGINDALALKRADVGIAVDNATDIAKESSDIILLEKDLGPILKSISTGRRALRNILTYIMYTLSGNAGTFFSLLVASFFYPVLPMLPIQILLNNLLTDLPLMLIITDNPDEYALRHVPHFEPKKIMQRVFIFGVVSSVFDLLYFQLYKNANVAEFQTGWFVLSILAELILILSIRSSRFVFKSPALSIPLLTGIVISAVLPFLFIYNPSLAAIFKFAPLSLSSVLVICGMIIVYSITNEIVKYFMRKKNLYNKPTPILFSHSQS